LRALKTWSCCVSQSIVSICASMRIAFFRILRVKRGCARTWRGSSNREVRTGLDHIVILISSDTRGKGAAVSPIAPTSKSGTELNFTNSVNPKGTSSIGCKASNRNVWWARRQETPRPCPRPKIFNMHKITHKSPSQPETFPPHRAYQLFNA